MFLETQIASIIGDLEENSRQRLCDASECRGQAPGSATVTPCCRASDKVVAQQISNLLYRGFPTGFQPAGLPLLRTAPPSEGPADWEIGI
jgi:hypothetical protein